MPRTVDVNRINQALETYKALRLSDFSQGLENDIVGDGVCRGMCLDWIRRILTPKLRKKSGFGQRDRSAFYNAEDPIGKIKSRLKLIRVTHDTFVPGQRPPADFKAAALVQIRIQLGLSDAQLPDFELATMMALPADTTTAILAAVRTLRADAAFSGMLVLSQQPAKFYAAYPKFQEDWKVVATKSQYWGLTSVPRESNYDNIHLMGRKEPWITQGPPWTTVAPAVSSLPNHQAGILLMAASTDQRGNAGHAVAFYRERDGTEIYYMDPNFGEFVGHESDIGRLFGELWDAAYAVYSLYQYYIFGTTEDLDS
jgi:hypothetical protein